MNHQILIVDDLKGIYRKIQSVLEPRGCEITYCETGESGIEAAQNHLYDLIILDIHLPNMNGIEVCKTLKKLPNYQHRPVLLLTSDTRKLELGLMAGASDYILKPFNELEMIARVFTQINLSKEKLKSISEKQSLQNDLQKQEFKLKEVQNDLHQYFYQTAHKLRSPLSSMEGLIQLLQYEKPDICQHEYMKMLKKTIDKMSYVNHQISKIGEIKSSVIKPKKFKLHSFISKILKTHFFQHSIKTNISHDILLETDTTIFQNGLKPIIENAIYYTCLKKKVQSIIIEINLVQKNDSYYLMIRDNGPGIYKEELDKISSIFHVGTDKSQGNGLGLFISKIALNKIGMELHFESKLDQFTEVQIDLTRAIDKSLGSELKYQIIA